MYSFLSYSVELQVLNLAKSVVKLSSNSWAFFRTRENLIDMLFDYSLNCGMLEFFDLKKLCNSQNKQIVFAINNEQVNYLGYMLLIKVLLHSRFFWFFFFWTQKTRKNKKGARSSFGNRDI